VLAIFCGKFIQFLACALITVFYGPEIAHTARRAFHEHFGIAVAVLAAVGVAVGIYVLRKLFDKRPDASFPMEEQAEGEAAIETEDEDSTLIT